MTFNETTATVIKILSILIKIIIIKIAVIKIARFKLELENAIFSQLNYVKQNVIKAHQALGPQ